MFEHFISACKPPPVIANQNGGSIPERVGSQIIQVFIFEDVRN